MLKGKELLVASVVGAHDDDDDDDDVKFMLFVPLTDFLPHF